MVGAGNVLRLMGVFRDLNTPPSGSPALNYAQCVNYKNKVRTRHTYLQHRDHR